MQNHEPVPPNKEELERERLALEDRIRRLEADLKCPLEADSEEQAAQLSNQMLLRRLLEIEKNYLLKINQEIQRIGP
jgi:RNA polymerase-binding transcription factor DksA